MQPLVSVFCPTYNHENFIQQCLDSIVNQKTSFPFEIIVQDDASTDNTPAIIREYAGKYDFIIPVLHNKNYFSQGKSINEYFFKNARGKYLAVCEGDDYWTDPYKLQRQVDFLEANPDYSYCCARIQVLNMSTGETVSYLEEYFSDLKDKIITMGNFYSPYVTHTATVMFRRKYISDIDVSNKLFVDLTLYVHLLSKGNGYCLNHFVAIYRLSGQGIWSSLDIYNRQKNAYFISYNICSQYKSKYPLLKEFHRHNFNMLSSHLHQKKNALLFLHVFLREFYLYVFTGDKYSVSILLSMVYSSFRNRFAHLLIRTK